MPFRVRAWQEAKESARRDVAELGRELTGARRSAGVSQREVARVLGWSASRVGRIERGEREGVAHVELAMLAAVVGLHYSGKLFVGRYRIRDSAQLATVESYRRFAATAGWECRMEEPLPISGDLRAFDLVIRAGGVRVAHEFVSRLRDVQGQVRPLLTKQRDAGVGRLVLVLRDTAENRHAVRTAGDQLMALFPVSARDVLGAIRARREPPGNGIVFWRDARHGAAPGASMRR